MFNRRRTNVRSVFGLMAAAVVLVALSACELGGGLIEEGKVTTVAGPFRNTAGTGDSDVRGIAVDLDGNVYFNDHHKEKVIKMTPQGVQTDFYSASSGSWPLYICYGMDGKLYVYERDAKKIKRFNLSGTQEADITFNDGVLGMAADSAGNVYIADGGGDRILKMTSGGTVTTFAGGTKGFANGNGADAMFQYPSGIAIDKQGNLYVSDGYNHCIRKITPNADVSVYASYAGSWGFVDGDSGSAKFGIIHGMTINLATGDLYVFDRSSGGVRKITPGREVMPLDPPGANPLVKEEKIPIVVGRSVSTIAGDRKWDSKEAGLINGPAFSARFGWVKSDGTLGHPFALAADTFGNVYVADDENHVVRKITQ